MEAYHNLRARLGSLRERLTGAGHVITLARGATANFTIKVLGTAIALCVQIVLAQLLGVKSFGNYIYVLTWVGVLVTLVKLGFDTASVRFIAAYNARQEWGMLHGFLQYSSRLVIRTSAIVILFFVSAIWLFKDRLSIELLYTFGVACIALPVMAKMHLTAGRLQGFKKVVQAIAAVEIFRPLILLIVLLVSFILLGLKPHAANAMMINLLSIATTLCVMMLLLKRVLPARPELKPHYSNSTEWFRTARDLLLVSGFALILFQADILMVGALLGTKEAGIYAVASRLAGLLVFVLVAINAILSPTVAELYAQNKMQKLQYVFTLSVKGAFLFSLLMGAGLIVWGDLFLSMFGKEFIAAFLALKILIIGQVCNAAVGSVGVLLNMTGHQSDAVKVLAVSAVLNIALNWVLIKVYGVNGAAAATAIVMVLTNGTFAFLVWKRLKIVALPTTFRSRYEA
jgi:O-antigen/teichoic acid export membrane protein